MVGDMIVAGEPGGLRDTPTMTTGPATGTELLGAVRMVVDEVLVEYLGSRGGDIDGLDAHASMLVDEIARLVRAGGKRIRPAFCISGYRAASPGPWSASAMHPDEPIVRAAAALELLHTMALIHDDLMDGATQRRGVVASSTQLASEALDRGFPRDAVDFGRAAALLAGDLAAVLADGLLLSSGFDAAAIVRALAPYHQMRLEMAAGQLLDIAGLASEAPAAARAARLKGGSYTVEGPLMVGAALAGDRADVRDALRAFGVPLGEAFQFRDDLLDGEEARGVTPATVNQLVHRARTALRGAPFDPETAAALDELASWVAIT